LGCQLDRIISYHRRIRERRKRKHNRLLEGKLKVSIDFYASLVMTEPKARIPPYGNVPEHHFKVSVEAVIGFCAETKRTKKGENIKVLQRAFLTDIDGDQFYTILDQISSVFLANWMKENRLIESNIINCLIILDDKNEAEIFINIPTIMQIITKRSLDSGSLVTKEDIADIRKIEFPGINIESYCGMFYIFSIGWRRGLYFDLMPLEEPKTKKNFKKLETLFATFYSYITFPEILKLDEHIMNKMMDDGWFPFTRILGKKFKNLYDDIKNDFPIMETSLNIVTSFDDKFISEMCDSWMSKDEFKKHEKIIRKGVEEYLEGDFISSIHILYPRIEGFIRLMCIEEKKHLKSTDLAKKLELVAREKEGLNLYLPEDFNKYLMKFYFANFNLNEELVPFSRNSLAHGVAKADDFDKIKAFQGIMMLDQIFFYV
jgi:hypothetical protein